VCMIFFQIGITTEEMLKGIEIDTMHFNITQETKVKKCTAGVMMRMQTFMISAAKLKKE
jgi:hypothetical protein